MEDRTEAFFDKLVMHAVSSGVMGHLLPSLGQAYLSGVTVSSPPLPGNLVIRSQRGCCLMKSQLLFESQVWWCGTHLPWHSKG